MAAATTATNWTNVVNVIGATMIVGSEAVGAGGATGWAIASLMKLGDQVILGATIAGVAIGLFATVAFFRSAHRVEPFS
jgi:hypothetical protein